MSTATVTETSRKAETRAAAPGTSCPRQCAHSFATAREITGWRRLPFPGPPPTISSSRWKPAEFARAISRPTWARNRSGAETVNRNTSRSR